PRCTRWVMSCHTPWRLTRTRTALRRGGIYESALGDVKRISDTTAPPSLLLWRLWPRHIPRRAGLLRHVAQGLPVRLPLLARRPLWARGVRQHDPVCLRKPAISLSAKRCPRLSLAFLLDLLFGAPRGLNVRHHSITSGSGNRSDSGASGPWNLSNVTSSFPFTRRAEIMGQMSSVDSKADTSSSPSGRLLKSKVSVCPSRVAVMVSPEISYDSWRSLRCGDQWTSITSTSRWRKRGYI